jgi:hypothetical protein
MGSTRGDPIPMERLMSCVNAAIVLAEIMFPSVACDH